MEEDILNYLLTVSAGHPVSNCNFPLEGIDVSIGAKAFFSSVYVCKKNAVKKDISLKYYRAKFDRVLSKITCKFVTRQVNQWKVR